MGGNAEYTYGKYPSGGGGAREAIWNVFQWLWKFHNDGELEARRR